MSSASVFPEPNASFNAPDVVYGFAKAWAEPVPEDRRLGVPI